ncbi:MAG: DUF1294 domain-containing protein [Anaerolineales bacterium]|nr:DUF1294 domain-containing protein [Anaerolineales bacterium]
MRASLRFGALGLVLLAVGMAALYSPAWSVRAAYASWLVAASAVTFVFYGVDKLQAKRSGLRVPEAELHALALVGGFAGGFAGRAVFRHKLRKPVFGRVLWLSLGLQLVCVATWLAASA